MLVRILITLMILSLGGCAYRVPEVPPEKLSAHVATMGLKPTPAMVHVDTKQQTLTVLENNQVKKTYIISTSQKGLGQRINSFKTPLGLHRVNDKIGDRVPKYGIFQKREYVGATWKKLPRHKHNIDYISTRILRLEGLQPGFNRGRDWLGRVVDTEKRAVYIHGTTMEWKLGAPSTKGCVHMSADDVIALFKTVPVGSLVWIN